MVRRPGAAELIDWEPVLTRAGVHVLPERVAQAYLELAVLVRALEGLSASARIDAMPDPSSLWAGLFDLRENLLGRARRRPARPRRSLASYARAHVCARLTVVGSINLDLVARAERLPRPGETVTGATFSRIPGGKGANQAVAAARLGADVTMIACVGDDELRRARARRAAAGGRRGSTG